MSLYLILRSMTRCLRICMLRQDLCSILMDQALITLMIMLTRCQLVFIIVCMMSKELFI